MNDFHYSEWVSYRAIFVSVEEEIWLQLNTPTILINNSLKNLYLIIYVTCFDPAVLSSGVHLNMTRLLQKLSQKSYVNVYKYNTLRLT